MKFFNLGKENNWKNLLEPKIEEKIRVKFNKEMKFELLDEFLKVPENQELLSISPKLEYWGRQLQDLNTKRNHIYDNPDLSGERKSELIKKFGEDALIHYITSPSGKNVFSLGFLHKSQKFVLSLRFVEHGVSKSAMIVEAESKREKKVIEVPAEVTYKPKKSFGGSKTLLSKIKSIEGSGNG